MNSHELVWALERIEHALKAVADAINAQTAQAKELADAERRRPTVIRSL